MDDSTFDRLTRAVTAAGSRRAAITALAGGALATFAATAAEAKKKRKRKKKKKTQVIPPPASTCSDGIQNGDETGVDCGGSCPPCAVGQACTKRSDCVTALCVGGVCTACTFFPNNCGSNGATPCSCGSNDASTAAQCRQSTGPAATCAACPAGTTGCVPGMGAASCSRVCGDS